MSTCAVMLVKDELDIIEWQITRLLSQVDEILVADNLSTDGTLEILQELAGIYPEIRLSVDAEVGYFQSRKTTALAQEARERGHKWVVPTDADEFWHANDFRPLNRFLAGLGNDVQIVDALVYNHLPTSKDTVTDPNPFSRIGYRKKEWQSRKVAAKLRPDLQIEMGNHNATTSGTAVRGGGLSIRHYPHRSEAQYVHKIRNGIAAYAATDLDPQFGVGWRMMEGKSDQDLVDYFHEWWYSEAPDVDGELTFDPAPGGAKVSLFRGTWGVGA